MRRLKLHDVIQDLVKESPLVERLTDGALHCLACGHRCRIEPDHSGVCKLRHNRGGKLMVPWGYTAGRQIDPIEKKPFYHFVPDSKAYSFGMMGCNFHCSFCQNWISSQAIREGRTNMPVLEISEQQIVEEAVRNGCRSIVSTYNEPLVTSEWSCRIFELAREKGLLTGYVSNGYGSPEVLEFLSPHLDAYKIDLKSFRDAEYRKLGGKLDVVLDTIKDVHNRGIWMELVTLLIPNMNDSTDELTEMAEFIKSISADIPWHITAFHPDYKMTDRRATKASDLQHAAGIGRKVGLNFVYCGNRPGSVGNTENTYCPNCKELLVERRQFNVLCNRITDAGLCPACSHLIPGIWS